MRRKRHEKTFETLLQTKERLTRELRLRTEKRQRELLEPEQLAVKEDDSEFVESDSKEPEQVNRHLTTTNLVLSCLLIVVCLVSLAFVIWLNLNFVCYKI